MKNYLFILIALLVGTQLSCGSEEKKAKEDDKFYTTEIPKADELRVGIKQLEDSVMKLSRSGAENKVINLTQQALVEKLKLLYQAYPNDKDAAKSLAKVHMLYDAMGVPELSVQYADTLIERYPNFEGRLLAMESNATYYDVYAVPRNKEKVRYYLEKIIKEYPNSKSEIIVNAKFRLKHIDLTFEELIELQN